MNDGNPLISVVMPIYNAKEYLEMALTSIKEQVYTNYEVIMVNDCSTDNSLAVCEKWSQSDPRFKVISLKQNGGAGNARNIGMKQAVGDYLAFVDSDDIVSGEIFQQAVESLRTNPADQVIWGLTEVYYDGAGRRVKENQLIPNGCYCRDAEEVMEQVILLENKTLFGYQWNRLYRMSLIRDHNICFKDFPLYEDYFFNLAVIRKTGSLNVLPRSGYSYSKRDNQSLTSQFVKDYYRLSYLRISSMRSFYIEKNLCTKEVESILGNIYLRYVLSALMRNCDDRMGFSYRQRIDWIRRVANEKLYRQVVKTNKIDSKSLKVLQIAINKRAYPACLALGRILYMIKVVNGSLFALLKMKRV